MKINKTIKINYSMIAAFLCVAITFSFFIADTLAVDKSNIQTMEEQSDNSIKLPVAMYHHVLNESSRLNDYVISPAQFEQDLIYIKENGYTTISAQELIDFVENKTQLPQKPIMITFDDGYESVHEYAFPLLQKYQMKAIFSIIGKHTDIFSNPNEPKKIHYSHASWEQLREMQESGLFEIGNHTYDMHNTQNSPRYGIRQKKGEDDDAYEKVLNFDIGGLNKQIENEIGISPIVFAYPFGALSKASKPILENMGFKIILTCEEKVNIIKPDVSIPIRLKRFNRATKYTTYDYFQKLFK